MLAAACSFGAVGIENGSLDLAVASEALNHGRVDSVAVDGGFAVGVLAGEGFDVGDDEHGRFGAT